MVPLKDAGPEVGERRVVKASSARATKILRDGRLDESRSCVFSTREDALMEVRVKTQESIDDQLRAGIRLRYGRTPCRTYGVRGQAVEDERRREFTHSDCEARFSQRASHNDTSTTTNTDTTHPESLLLATCRLPCYCNARSTRTRTSANKQHQHQPESDCC